MIFRFMKYNYQKEDKYDSLDMVCSYTAKKYDRFLEYLRLMKKYEYMMLLNNKWYLIDDIIGTYHDDGDLFCTDVYVVEVL